MWKNTLCVWEFTRINNSPMISRLCTAAIINSEQDDDKSLTKEKAHALVMKLTNEERDNLAWCLNHYESEETKAEYRGSVPSKAIKFWTVCMKSLSNTFKIYFFLILILKPKLDFNIFHQILIYLLDA